MSEYEPDIREDDPAAPPDGEAAHAAMGLLLASEEARADAVEEAPTMPRAAVTEAAEAPAPEAPAPEAPAPEAPAPEAPAPEAPAPEAPAPEAPEAAEAPLPHGPRHDPPHEPQAEAPRGTVLIPAGAVVLPEDLRQPLPHDEDDSPEATSADVPEGAEAASTMDLGAALAAAARTASIPPVRVSTDPPVLHPSLPGSRAPVGPGSIDVKHGRFRQRAVLLIALLGLGAMLTTVAILVVAQQRADARRERVQQVLAAHAVALATVEEANDRIIEAMRSLAAEDRPDLAELAKASAEAGKLFEGLRVPAARGDQVQLGRRLQNAIEAETSFLDRLSDFGGRALADVHDADIDRLQEGWSTAEAAIRASYDDQPELDVPDLSRVGDTLSDFGSGMARAAEDARERAVKLGGIRDYMDQVAGVLSELERLRASLTRANIRAMVIRDSSDRSNALGIISAASTGRWSLAETLGEMAPPDEMTAQHAGLIDAIEGLARAVTGLVSAVSEADCTSYSYYGSYYYDSEPDCSPVGSTSAYRGFVRDSDAAGSQYDRAKAAHQARYAELVEAYR